MSHMPHYPVQSGRNVRVRSGGSFLRSRRRTGFRCTGSASSAARKRPRAEPPAASHIATGHLLRETIYPPGQASDTLATRTVSQAYNALGQVIWMKDQAGNITEFEYDKAGRETMRRELPDCIECAYRVPDLAPIWPPQIANCRPDQYGAENACNDQTRAKLLRCRSRRAWNGCPPIPRFTYPAGHSGGQVTGQE
jgi:YD repeat-containing protein